MVACALCTVILIFLFDFGWRSFEFRNFSYKKETTKKIWWKSCHGREEKLTWNLGRKMSQFPCPFQTQGHTRTGDLSSSLCALLINGRNKVPQFDSTGRNMFVTELSCCSSCLQGQTLVSPPAGKSAARLGHLWGPVHTGCGAHCRRHHATTEHSCKWGCVHLHVFSVQVSSKDLQA